MQPNSRIVPTSADAQPRKRTMSAAPPSTYTSQSTPSSKHFLSRFLANGQTPPASPRPTASHSSFISSPSSSGSSVPHGQDVPAYASRARPATLMETYAESASPLGAATANDSQLKKPSKSKSGFGRFFRKLGKTQDEDLIDDLPKVRPISANHRIASRTPHTIPLAPPPPLPPKAPGRLLDQGNPTDGRHREHLTRPHNPTHPAIDAVHEAPVQAAPHFQSSTPTTTTTHTTIPSSTATATTAPVTANTSTTPDDPVPHKSASIYSTFDADGSDTALDQLHHTDKASHLPNTAWTTPEAASVDSFNTVHTTLVPEERLGTSFEMGCIVEDRETSHDEEDDSHHDDSDNDDEEDDSDDDDDDVFVDATGSSQDDIARESRLSKRLSGGHFGSAGGLIASTSSTSDTMKRRSRPPPEDIAKAMLKWKRHSGGTNKRASGISLGQWAIEPEAIPVPAEAPTDDLSLPDKQAQRDQAADTLVGKRRPSVQVGHSPTTNQTESKKAPSAPAISQPPESSSSSASRADNADRSLKYLSEAFSQTLDAAWLDPDPNIAVVRDPRRQSIDNGRRKEASEAAERLWNEDETFVEKAHIAEWLGQSKPLHSDALVLYMDHFDFTDMRLDSAFRKLCSKLYFKAEAQQIDRILEVFAKRYWTCNPNSILKSADVAYAVVYSVLLLNTDLHVAQGSYHRMTRQEFLRNTMSAIHDQRSVIQDPETFSSAWEASMETYLKELYLSVKQYQILQPLSRQPSQNEMADRRASILGNRRVVGLKRSVGSIIRRSGRESMLVPDDAQVRAGSLHGHPRPGSPSVRSPRRESFSSINSATSFGSRARASTLSPTLLHHPPLMHFMDTHSAALFVSRPPYYKEGVVMRKHLLETGHQKARHREWRECFLVVSDGELSMYSLQNATADSERRSILRASSASMATLTDPDRPAYLQSSSASFTPGAHKWAAQSQLLFSLNLSHTLANVLPPPGYNRQRPYVFALQQADGGVFLFQAATLEQVTEWTATCNYWAARESKEPMRGGVSNMEYGWGPCLNDVILDLDAVERNQPVSGEYLQDPDSVVIYDWQPPAPPKAVSNLDEVAQYNALQKYLKTLDAEINEHRELKKKMLVKFPSKCANHAKVMANWDAKSKYLLHDIIKYQNYCLALEKSIQKHKAEEQEAKARRLDYRESSVDLIKEIGDELQLAF